MNVEQPYYDVLPTIAAENAALRVKIKQEYDVTSVIRDDVQKATQCIDLLKRDNDRYDELLESKAQELTKLEEELTNLSVSREHIQKNIDNLKRQHDLVTIGDEQERKEQDSVRANYETMIRTRREIFNSNRLVVRRNYVSNRCEAARIQFAVSKERLKELERQKRQFREIQNLHLKSVSVELADVWLSNKREKEKMITLKNTLRDKETLLNQLSMQKDEQEASTLRSPRSQFVSLPIPSPSPPIHIPLLKNMEENELTKYFQKINFFKKARSPVLLPPVLSRTALRKEKELLGSPKANSTLIESPVKKIKSIVAEGVKNSEADKSEPLKIIDVSEQTTRRTAFKPINISKENIDTKIVEPERISVHEKPNQMYTLLDNRSPKTDSPGKVKSTRLVDKRVSPLTVSRMSPLNVSHKSPKSRIPVPVCSSSPIPASRIPRFTPLKSNQKNLEKETTRRQDFAKKNHPDLDIIIDTSDTCKVKLNSQGGAKRIEVGSPKRSIKYPKMDYGFMKIHRKIHADESSEIQVDHLDDQMSKKLSKEDIENIYEEAINENNPIIRSHTERMKMYREGHFKNDLQKEKLEDEKVKKSLKNKPDFIEERKLPEMNDTRQLKNIDMSKEKYNEFVKHYEKFRAHDARKNDEHEPKNFIDMEKAGLEFNVKESVSRVDKKEEIVQKLNEKVDAPNADCVEYEYEDSFHAIPDMYSDPDDRLSKSSGVSNDSRNRSEVFSPFSNGYSFSPPSSNNFSTPFVPMGERGSMFSFGSSVNQLFGTTDGTNGQSKNQNNGFFGFNFSSSLDKTDEPFKLF